MSLFALTLTVAKLQESYSESKTQNREVLKAYPTLKKLSQAYREV